MPLLNPDGTINKKDAFCMCLNRIMPAPDKSLTELIQEFDQQIKVANPDVKAGALSNSHGDWYEWLLAISAWNYHAKNPESYFALLLPNVTQLDVAQLYEAEMADLIADLKVKLATSVDVQLITSNPDFVLIDASVIEVPPATLLPITRVDANTLDMIDNTYRHFIGQCNYESIVGYLSVKLSFRPDRRLQIAHEGSLSKAIYTHLQTRQWILQPRGLKYYCCAAEISPADRRGLKTVATHSITTVHSIPQAAVDDSFKVNSLEAADDMWDSILRT